MKVEGSDVFECVCRMPAPSKSCWSSGVGDRILDYFCSSLIGSVFNLSHVITASAFYFFLLIVFEERCYQAWQIILSFFCGYFFFSFCFFFNPAQLSLVVPPPFVFMRKRIYFPLPYCGWSLHLFKQYGTNKAAVNSHSECHWQAGVFISKPSFFFFNLFLWEPFLIMCIYIMVTWAKVCNIYLIPADVTVDWASQTVSKGNALDMSLFTHSAKLFHIFGDGV